MKLKLLLISVLALVVSPLFAQDGPPPPADQGNFFNTAFSWFTAFNTNNLWSQRGVFEAGIDTVSKSTAPLQNSLHLSYDVWKAVSADVTVRDSGVAGTFCSAGAGVGYSVKVNDAKLGLSVQGGRDFNGEKWFSEIAIQASKKLTKYTHAFVRMSARLPDGSRIFSGGVGFSF